METIIIHPQSKEQASLFEQLAKVLNVPFEKTEQAKLTEREKTIALYGKEFEEKNESSENNYKEGKYTTIKIEDLWK